MMRGKSFVVLAVLFLCACPAFAVIEFNDGQTHNIDYEISEEVWVDYQTPGMYTTVNVLEGGIIYGYTYTPLCAYESSRINICGGSVQIFNCYDSSRATVSGGSIPWGINCGGSSRIDVSGGLIGDDLRLGHQSEIRIFGYDFVVDGQPFGYGELTSIYGDKIYEPIRHLTGTLLSGDLIDVDFQIRHDARIVLIPEPAAVLLFGLGGLFLKRRRRE